MRANNGRKEKGVALLLSILALLLLTGVAVSMMYMASTEAVINSNFKAEETEYFAARAGVQEIRDRMIPGVAPYSISNILPTQLPTTGNQSVLYILQNGTTMANVINGTSATNATFDDELCHDFSFGGTLVQQAPNIRCDAVPAGNWYSTPAAPAAGSQYVSAAPYRLDWKWTRITLKSNNSTTYRVDSRPAAQNLTTQVCWDGNKEVLLGLKPDGTPAAQCNQMATPAYPVYLVTALAVNQNGARRLVQDELAQNPSGQPSGLFAVGNGCSALSMGGGAKTFSFDSTTEPGGPVDPPTNIVAAGGSVGTNGNATIGGGSVVNGNTYTNLSPTVGNCNAGNGATVNGGGSSPGTVASIPGYPQGTPYVAPVPPFPTNPVPPVGNVIYKNPSLPAGTYGDVVIKGNVTLPGGTVANPAVYTLNSLTVGPGNTLTINGPVIININYHGNGNAVSISGFANTTAVASNFVVNYGGFGSVSIASANAGAYAVVNAPNANVSLTGNANFYGQVLGASINVTGSAKFYWDLGINKQPNTTPFFEISMRELSY